MSWSRSLICSAAKLPLLICMLAVLASGVARADFENIGYFSFDVLNPAADGSPGINNFTIYNFTGPDFSSAHDFPVLDPLTFMGAEVTLSDASNNTVSYALGDLGPGSYTPDPLEFLDTALFSSATFQATLNQTSFALSDGTTFLTDSSTVSATILPSD